VDVFLLTYLNTNDPKNPLKSFETISGCCPGLDQAMQKSAGKIMRLSLWTVLKRFIEIKIGEVLQELQSDVLYLPIPIQALWKMKKNISCEFF
jgi:hypothetical protein